MKLRRGLAVATAGLFGSAGALASSVQPSAAAGASMTFTSSQIGTSGSTGQFSEGGNWTLSWSYDCSSFGSKGNFVVTVNQPSNDLTSDPGPNELGMSGSGTDYYTDSGTFSLSINSECSWSITVAPNTSGPGGPSETFSSSQTGSEGETPQFTEYGNWTMSWSYDCSAWGSQGNFIVNVNQPSGDFNNDTGPNELGTGGSGTDSYSDTGVFSLDVSSECSWSISVSGPSGPPPPPPHCNTALPSGTVVGMAATRDGRDIGSLVRPVRWPLVAMPRPWATVLTARPLSPRLLAAMGTSLSAAPARCRRSAQR